MLEHDEQLKMLIGVMTEELAAAKKENVELQDRFVKMAAERASALVKVEMLNRFLDTARHWSNRYREKADAMHSLLLSENAPLREAHNSLVVEKQRLADELVALKQRGSDAVR